VKAIFLLTSGILILTSLLSINCYATWDQLSREYFEKELVGAWVNNKYENDPYGSYQKVVFNSDFSMGLFKRDDSIPSTVRLIIDNRYIDDNGTVYYRMQMTMSIGTLYGLFRVNHSRTILEYEKSSANYPDKIDQSSGAYRIHYRQEP
jgi:hypothetical protein